MYGRQSHKIKSLYNDVSFCVFFWSKWHINDNAMINNNEKKLLKRMAVEEQKPISN